MKSPLIATILLVLAAPAFASPPPVTAAQKKDIHRLIIAYLRCGNYLTNNGSDPAYAIPEDENQMYKKSCDRVDKLEDELGKQGFCFYGGRLNIGRGSDRHCVPLHH